MRKETRILLNEKRWNKMRTNMVSYLLFNCCVIDYNFGF